MLNGIFIYFTNHQSFSLIVFVAEIVPRGAPEAFLPTVKLESPL
jgi:hypothetical protein